MEGYDRIDECISCHEIKYVDRWGCICQKCYEWHEANKNKNLLVKRKDVYKTPDRKTKAIVWSKSGGKCWYCGKMTNPFGRTRDSFCVDHFYSRKGGGGNEIENLVPCCVYCNTLKKDKTIEEARKILVGENSSFYFEMEGLS